MVYSATETLTCTEPGYGRLLNIVVFGGGETVWRVVEVVWDEPVALISMQATMNKASANSSALPKS